MSLNAAMHESENHNRAPKVMVPRVTVLRLTLPRHTHPRHTTTTTTATEEEEEVVQADTGTTHSQDNDTLHSYDDTTHLRSTRYWQGRSWALLDGDETLEFGTSY
jgi:hypothetical protein